MCKKTIPKTKMVYHFTKDCILRVELRLKPKAFESKCHISPASYSTWPRSEKCYQWKGPTKAMGPN